MIPIIRLLEDVSEDRILVEKLMIPLMHKRIYIFKDKPCLNCGGSHEMLMTVTIGLN